MLKFFSYEHLLLDLIAVSRKFYQLAHEIETELVPGPERSESLRKLLEAKDAAVRAKLFPVE